MLLPAAARRLSAAAAAAAARPSAERPSAAARGAVLVSTPIFYVNGSPHIGHAYSGLLADALARWLRLEGREVFFSTGTDEHGAKVDRAAAERGAASTADYCDAVSKEFKDLFEALGTSHDGFIRTTEPRHGANVAALWKRLQHAGFIRLGEHHGWYCQSDEAFLTEKQVGHDAGDDDGKMVSLESGHPVEWVSESNYVFPLSTFHDKLLAWLAANDRASVQPPTRWNEVDAFLRQSGPDGKPELEDLSVSRPRDRVRWAWPVPTDDTQSIYVWLDALANYLTAAGVQVPEDPAQPVSWQDAGVSRVIHVIGKDILRFHTVYWPAFLMAAGIEVPDTVFAHGHWTVDRTKMSKSLGNVVDPMELVNTYGVDAVRYSLLRNGSIANDLDFSNEMLEARRRDELINTYGNLLARCTGKSLAPEETWPSPAAQTDPSASELATKHLIGLADAVGAHYERLEFARGASEIMDVLYEANRVVTVEEPWVLRKKLRQDPDAADADELRARLDTSMYWFLETVRVTSILLQPIVPEAATRALDALGIPADQRTAAHARVVGGASPAAFAMQRPAKGSIVLVPPLEKPSAK